MKRRLGPPIAGQFLWPRLCRHHLAEAALAHLWCEIK